MTAIRSIIAAVFASLIATTLLPAGAGAQVTSSNSLKAEAAILSAGSRAAAIASLEAVGHISVIDLKFNTKPLRLRGNDPDPSAFRVSAGKNFKGISRLRAALAANPATRAALSRKGIALNRVVGVDIYSNGSIRLYIL